MFEILSKKYLWIILLCFYSSILIGAEYYKVKRSIVIRAQPSLKAKVVGHLEPGREIYIQTGTKARSHWKKIELVNEGVVGFIELTQWENWVEPLEDEFDNELDQEKSQNTSLFYYGVFISGSFFYQGSRSFSSETSGNVNIGTFQGNTLYYGFLLEIPFRSQYSFETRLIFRNINSSGNAQPSSTYISSSQSKVTMQQSFIGGGLYFKNYFTSPFWWAIGGEIDRGQKINLWFGSTPVDTQDLPLPTFALLSFSSGMNYPLTKKLILNPELALNIITNTSPIALLFDIVISIKY